MEINRAELKRQARERMALTDPGFRVVALAYIAMTTGVSWLFSFLPIPHTQTSLLFIQFLMSLYTMVVQFGLCLWALWTWRQLDPGINSLMQGFSVAGRVVLMKLGIMVRVLGWYFLASFLLGTPVLLMIATGAGPAFGISSLLLFTGGLFAIAVMLMLRYALAPYLLADRPDDGPTAPILRSASLMRGWKWELFKLEFSFIGWYLLIAALNIGVHLFFANMAGLPYPATFPDPAWLEQSLKVVYSPAATVVSSLITFPINLWLLPYRQTALAGFYDARLVAASQEEQLPQMPPL